MTGKWLEQWLSLDDWLVRHHVFFAVSPFVRVEPDWVLQWPALDERLQALSDDDCEHLENNRQDLGALLGEHIPSLIQGYELTLVPELSATSLALPEKQAPGMPGRKRLQAGAFAGALFPLNEQVMDWCCGAGHLARTLAASGAVAVDGVEWNPTLVEKGNREAQRHGEPVRLREQNVLAEHWSWPETEQVVALHACGDLHRTLIRDGAKRHLPRVSFSPCCYHLTRDQFPGLLSEQARRLGSEWYPDPSQRRLAVQEVVTASHGETDRARTARAWRLGYEALRRHLTGEETYQPLRSVPVPILRKDFSDFCFWGADQHGLTLDDGTRFEDWEARGFQDEARVRRRELVWHWFRRPLELWLVLDYAVFLQEQGYSVTVGTFCDRKLTPRNLLVDARRLQGS